MLVRSVQASIPELICLCMCGADSDYFDFLRPSLYQEKEKGLKLWVLGLLLKSWVVGWGNSLLVTHSDSKVEPPTFPNQFLTSCLWVLT